MFIELLPMHECTLQRNAGCACDVIAGIFQDIVQMGGQGSEALRQHNAELGEQSSNAVNACCAFLFEPFTQLMHAQYALLLWNPSPCAATADTSGAASMLTRHSAGNCAHHAKNLLRWMARLETILP